MPLPSFTHEILLTTIAWVVLAAVVVWMSLCQVWSDMRWDSRRHHQKEVSHDKLSSIAGNNTNISYEMLNDVVLNHLEYPMQRWISDVLVNSAAGIAIIGGMLMVRGWRARLVLLRRVAWIMAILYFLRSLTISVTTIPPSTRNCVPRIPHNITELLDIVPKMITGKLSGCTDKIFSGHTTVLIVSFLVWTRYARHWAFVAYSAVHTLLGIASVMAVRLHYSVDVLLAVVLAFFVHHVYYLSLQEAVQSQWHNCDGCKLHSSNIGDQYCLVVETKGENSDLCNIAAECALSINLGDSFAPVNENLWPQAQLQTRLPVNDVPDGSNLVNTGPVHSKYSENITEFACNQQYQVDAEMLFNNRRPTMYLPNIVAWMDGLWLR